MISAYNYSQITYVVVSPSKLVAYAETGSALELAKGAGSLHSTNDNVLQINRDSPEFSASVFTCQALCWTERIYNVVILVITLSPTP